MYLINITCLSGQLFHDSTSTRRIVIKKSTFSLGLSCIPLPNVIIIIRDFSTIDERFPLKLLGRSKKYLLDSISRLVAWKITKFPLSIVFRAATRDCTRVSCRVPTPYETGDISCLLYRVSPKTLRKSPACSYAMRAYNANR